MAPHKFDLVGAHPALDFLNTVHDWTVDAPRDYLPDYSEALRFGEVAGVLSRSEARALAPQSAGAETRRLRELRSRIERVFRAAVTGAAPSPTDLDALARDAAEASRTARLRRANGKVARSLDAAEAGRALLRMRLVESAVELLTSERMARVKSCPSCGWFFLDVTKNGSRRWCSMDMCGSSAKSRAYYWRNRAKG